MYKKMEITIVQKSIVFTFLGNDKPGLVEQLATTVNSVGGNWLESNLAYMAGKFAGIVRVSIATENANDLEKLLLQHNSTTLTVTVDNCEQAVEASVHHGKLSVIGNDRSGIVEEVTKALASHGINIQELQSRVSSAPMTATPLFEAEICFQVSAQTKADAVTTELDDIADKLDIDVSLEWLEQ
jgi:glycine cleavage system regulatory protein